ncbi:ferritin-like domain-containing protein [Sphingomonas sp. R-74633]|uniref:ferritin-like domain-containing protein n=1 Tax=Sphingomonas sp. R-74633 TaxID=2751188 RepID=UPI0015D272F2|nr:ferritin-like domain-containing protein [Sphingomonas sp. R-74633]NYT39245.1 ferritin-like domain-containing protein [Sphingomonas sp. R-74633]
MTSVASPRDHVPNAHPKGLERREALFAVPLVLASLVTAGLATAQALYTDTNLINFLLNVQYLEAQYHSYATSGVGLPANLLTGTGTASAATGGRQVTFTDANLAAYAKEIAADKLGHVMALRAQLGGSAIAQPAIDIGGTGANAFSALARLADNDSGGVFDPYASENNYLIGAFIIADVSVTASRGILQSLDGRGAALDVAVGIMTAQAYHAAAIRSILYARGIITFALIDAAEKFSAARDSLDGTADDDQGIAVIKGPPAESNIAPVDTSGRIFSRPPTQALNLLYLNASAVSSGGFFPAGVNGGFVRSDAN